MNEPIAGIIAYPVTPFTPGGDKVDTAKLAQLVEQLIDTGAHAIAPWAAPASPPT